MLGDALVYAMSLYAVGRPLRVRAGVALIKGCVIALLGVSIAVEGALKIVHGVVPVAGTMLVFGTLALTANLACVALLYRHRQHDVNLESTFECSRNDVIANGGVLLAASGVLWLDSGWPDIVVGAIIAALFLRSATRVLRQAFPQWRGALNA
jgi:Co/Zn/Cd efflux system component